MSLLKPHSEPLFSPLTESSGNEVPPPPELADGEAIYKVLAILDSRWQCQKLEYLIDPEERSESLNCYTHQSAYSSNSMPLFQINSVLYQLTCLPPSVV